SRGSTPRAVPPRVCAVPVRPSYASPRHVPVLPPLLVGRPTNKVMGSTIPHRPPSPSSVGRRVDHRQRRHRLFPGGTAGALSSGKFQTSKGILSGWRWITTCIWCVLRSNVLVSRLLPPLSAPERCSSLLPRGLQRPPREGTTEFRTPHATTANTRFDTGRRESCHVLRSRRKSGERHRGKHPGCHRRHHCHRHPSTSDRPRLTGVSLCVHRSPCRLRPHQRERWCTRPQDRLPGPGRFV